MKEIPIVDNHTCNKDSPPIGKIQLKEGFGKKFVEHKLCLAFAYNKETKEILYAYPVWAEHAENKEKKRCMFKSVTGLQCVLDADHEGSCFGGRG